MNRLSLSLFLAALTASNLNAQAGQIVGPVIDATTAIRSTLGFANADSFAGACRDNAGFYWTSCRASGQTFLIRINPAGAVTGFITTTIVNNVRDLAFDAAQGHLWVLATNDNARIYDVLTGANVGSTSGGSPTPYQGIAWDGASTMRLAGSNRVFSTSNFQISFTTSLPSATRGLLFDPTEGVFWGGMNDNDPGNLTQCEFREIVPGAGLATFPPHLDGITLNGRHGGQLGGCEQWQDPVTNEWLGVFCQLGDNDACWLYTARLSRPTGPGCGGPEYTKGPAIVQQQVYSSAGQAQSLAWLLISLAPGTVTDPLLAPGCVAHLNPFLTVALGPYFPTPSGSVTAMTTIPVNPAFQELPLFFQWGTIASIQNTATLGEARSAVIKQF